MSKALNVNKNWPWRTFFYFCDILVSYFTYTSNYYFAEFIPVPGILVISNYNEKYQYFQFIYSFFKAIQFYFKCNVINKHSLIFI